MSISSRIASMEEHIGNAYQGLQNIGVDITGVNKNIENISSMLEEAYKEAPKVSDTGTDITLDNTRKGRVDMGFSGNTSQFTTTGKNLLPNDTETKTRNGITITKNSDGTYKINGTATDDFSEAICNNFIPMSGTWRMLGCPSGGSDSTYMLSAYVGYWGAGSPNIDIGNGTNITYTGNVKVRFYIKSGTTCNNLIFKPMLTTDTTTTINNFEPYTGGIASPNPDYPQEVHVVSGNNSITICGKNLLPISTLSTSTKNGITFTNNNDGSYTFNGTATAYTTFVLNNNLSFNGNYTYVMRDTATSGFVMYLQSSSGQGIGQATTHTTIDNSIGIMVIGINNGVSLNNVTIKPYVYKGAYDSTIEYEPYQSNTYNIDLPVENLFDKSTAQLNVGINTSNGNTYNDTNLFSTDYIPISINTTYRANSASTTGNRVFGACYDSNKSYLEAVSTGVGERVFTVTNANAKYIRITGQKVNIDTYQLEKGSKSNSYTPFGTTPIELAEISTYNDEIFRTSGKNLCNATFELGGIDTQTGQDGDGTDRVRTKGYVEVKPNTTYTLSGVQGSRVVCFYNSSKTYLSYAVAGSQSTSGTFTTPNNTAYIRWYIIQTNTNIYEMLNEGSTALPYEPYGTGEWYLHKEIGKYEINGNEATDIGGTSFASMYARGYLVRVITISDLLSQNTRINIISNCFSVSESSLWDATKEGIQQYLNANKVLISASSNDIETYYGTTLNVNNYVGAYLSYLAHIETQFYYVLAPLTFTKITSSNYPTLYSQLEAIYNAQSKENQTNISQTNNDLPFIISASALKEWQESTSLNSTLSMVNPLSLGNTLNTQEIENNIQPIEVDNIEPLEEEENEES